MTRLLGRATLQHLGDLAFLAPALAVLALFLFYPLLYGLDLSLHRTQGFAVVSFVGLDNYVRAIAGDSVFQRGLVNTLAFTGAAVVLQTGLGLVLALLVAGTRRGRTVLQIAFIAPFVVAAVAAGAVWKFIYAPFFGLVPTLASTVGVDAGNVAPLADPNTALWAVLIAFLWRFAGFAMVVYLAAIQALPREYYETAAIEGASALERLRLITWPLLWPQTFALVLLTTIATLRIFDMVWIMTAGGPSHATETVATHVYTTAFRSLDIGYAPGDGDHPHGRDPRAERRGVPHPQSPERGSQRMTRRRTFPWTTALLVLLAVLWTYPVLWSLSNALKTTADIYRGPLDLPWPPAIGNFAAAWTRANLGSALLNSLYVTSMTVAGVLLLAIPAAYALARLRPPGRAILTLAVLVRSSSRRRC